MKKRISLLFILTAFILSSCGDGFTVQSEIDPDRGDDIVGGEEVPRGDVRGFYVAKLLVNKGAEQATCTATHVTPTILITAAHCFISKNVRDMRLVYRTHAWSGQTRLVKKIVIHDDYPEAVKSDLALIKIYGLKPETQAILPLNYKKPAADGFNILSIGFGITNTKRKGDNDGKGIGILRSVQKRVAGYSISGDDFMISMADGKGINSGDSGGPAIYFTDKGPTILGIARSVDYHISGRTRIFDSFGFYTPISFHKDWVLKNINTLEKSRD